MTMQDWYLNQMNITQYVLRKPSAIKGESLINITDNIRLIVVVQPHPKETIFYDILNAIHVSIEDCLILSPNQLIMPIDQLKNAIWFIDQALPDNWQAATARKDKAIIETVSLSQLASSPNLKRQLWQNLCQYERYFKTH